VARRRTSRPDYSWTNFADTELDLDLSTSVAQFGTTASTVLTPQTLIRTRGAVGVTLDPAAVNESALIIVGITVVLADHFTQGNPPEIVTNSDDEGSWIWIGSLYVHSGNEAAVNPNRLSDSIEIDAKSMRKLKPGQAIVMVINTPAATVTDQGGTYDLIYYVHCLNQS